MAPGVLQRQGNDVLNRDNSNSIIFDTSKNELFKINDGFKTLHRKLKSTWKVLSNKENLSPEILSQAKVFVLPCPREKFSEAEFNSMKQYLDSGGRVLVMMAEGGEKRYSTNINFFLEEFGIMVNNDAVVRTVYYKYSHPKEALILNGVLNRAVSQAAGKIVPGGNFDEGNNTQALSFLYPYGATLNVAKPAVAILSCGTASFPLNRPVCAFYSNEKTGGKLVCIGSVHMFHDQYIEKEENSKVKDVIFQFLTSNDFKLNAIDAEDPEISDYNMIPDIAKLSSQLRSCLQETEEIPSDFTQLFDQNFYQINQNVLPSVLKAYDELNIKHELLRLIPPKFENPLPALNPAVYPPAFRELPPPSLDLFDLDEQLSSEQARLAQITNKCTNDDLEYYIRECGDILNVTANLPFNKRQGKYILEYIFTQVVEFKKLNQEKEETSEM